MIKTDWNFKRTQSVRRVYGGSVGFRILVFYITARTLHARTLREEYVLCL